MIRDTSFQRTNLHWKSSRGHSLPIGILKPRPSIRAYRLIVCRFIRTRAFSVGMVPYADFFNHDPTMKDSNYYYDKVDDMFKVLASKDYNVGDEVMITYLGVSARSTIMNSIFLLTIEICRVDSACQILVYSTITDSLCLMLLKIQ